MMIRKCDSMSEAKKTKFKTAKNSKMEEMKKQQEKANSVSTKNEYTHIRISKETKEVLEDIRHALRKIEGSNVTANDLVKEGLDLICEKQGIDISKYQ